MKKILSLFLILIICLSSVVVYATQPKEGADPSQLNYCKSGQDNVTDCVMPIVDNCIGAHEFNCIVPEPFEPYIQYVFKDVWDESAWYFEPIYDVYDRELMIGYPDGTFGLGEELTWVQTVTLAMRTEHYLTGKVYTHKYEKPEHWYSEDLANALESGIITKIPADVNAPISRGDMAVIFSKVIPYFESYVEYTHQEAHPDVANVDFKDLQYANEEVQGAVNSLVDMGILNGKAQDFFAVNDSLKREEIAAVISRIINLIESHNIEIDR